MVKPSLIEALAARAVKLAGEIPVSEAMAILNEMARALDLPQDGPPPEDLARTLFETMEMKQHLENLTMRMDLPHPARFRHLEALRDGLLL